MTNKSILIRLWAIILCLIVIIQGTSYGTLKEQRGRSLSTRTLRTMCRAYLAYGQYDKARTLAETAALQAQRDGVEISEQALCLIDLATVYSYENMLEDAAARFEQGLALQKTALGRQHPYTAHTLRMLSDVYRRQDKLKAAEAALGEAFSVMLGHTRLQSREMTPFIIASAQLAAAAGRFEESRKTYDTAQQMLLTTYGPDHLYTAQLMQGAAETALACGDIQDAREQIDRSMQLQKRFFGEQSQMLIAGWLVQARIERAYGALGESEATLQKAITAARQNNNVVTLARVYEQVGAIRGEGVYTAAIQSSL